MLRRGLLSVLVALPLLALPASPALAQTVSCAGVAPWNATTVYNAGDRMVHQGKLYQANTQIWNTPPDYCPSCGWYTLLGTCGTGGDTTGPSIPTGLNSPSRTSTSVSLAWNASTDNPGGSGVAGYDVYRGGALAGSPTGTSFTVTGLGPNTTYSFTVRARDNAGNASAQGAALSVTTNPAAGCSTLPSVPTGLGSPSQTSSTVSLAWNASTPGANCTVQYRVFRDGTQATQVSATSATIGGLAANTTYSFTVAAVNQFGSSAQGPSLPVRTLGGGSCTAPQYVAGTAYTAGQQVQNVGQLYRCDVAGWCSSSAAWAYAPGTGMHWRDAWTHLGPCGGGGSPPAVALTAPANNSSFPVGTNVQVSANASDSDGTVVRVEFFADGLKFAEDTSSPYSAAWSGGGAGAHSLTARATDNASNTTTSAAVNVTLTCTGTCTQLPRRLLIGYWHNFDNGSGFIKLRDVSPDWDFVNIAFGEPVGGSTSTIGFTPFNGTTAAEMQSDVAILHGRGKKVLLSIGGANGHVVLPTAAARTAFVNSVGAIVQQYGLDGIDIDFEGTSVSLNAGDTDFANSTTPSIVNLIGAIRDLRSRFGPSFILTMAPETFFVQVGHQFYGPNNGGDARTGAYLPVIHGVRDILTVLHVQDYNSGPVTALDGQLYNMGNADFHVAMTEMLMTGFPVANTGRFFPGLRQDQVAIGLPANGNAGNGFTPVAEVHRALNYLIKGQPFGGRYVLRNASGHPNLRGLMSWSINWDRFANFDFSRNHRVYLNALP
jgi:chitinase